MALKIETTIRNINEYTRRDWIAEHGIGAEYDILLGLEEEGIPVMVDCIATDGYYDITTPSGRKIAALSWYHLNGFDEQGIPELRMD